MSLAAFLLLLTALYGVVVPVAPADAALIQSAALLRREDLYLGGCGEHLYERATGAHHIRVRIPDGACPVRHLVYVVRHEIGHAVCIARWDDRSEVCADRWSGFEVRE